MSPVSEGLVDIAIAQVIIPMVANWVRKEPGLTDAQIIARYEARKQRILTKGRAFLDETAADGSDSDEHTD